MFDQGTVYLLNGLHYYFIISDPSREPESVVVVNMTTRRGFASEDGSCVLSGGEHPVIRHESWIKYERAEVVPLRMLNHWYKINTITEVFPDQCHPALIQRIITGAGTSKLTPKKVLTVLQRQALI